ncbi:ComF family protein [Wielerella bovis]|uniref:ComF family protein n=1 Tax=Wielerella bovis TaxID=2917790 RepID=UPI00201893D9|nr:ComF family protein [Wielerella bovis]ULJ60674.1 ComF family protein [Wielerella bovis]
MPILHHKTCLLCHFQAASNICEGCLNDIRRLYQRTEHVCPQCAQFNMNGAICGKCQLSPPPYQKLWACAQYHAPLPNLLHEWKHTQRSEFTSIFATILRENPPPWQPEKHCDAILAMPISRERRLMRGFNQCDDLAHVITQHYKLPLLPNNTVFRKHKPPQSSLKAAERATNIQNVFQVNGDVKNCKLLIIDDVMTTGATIAELAQTLLNSGASEIYACVVMRN